MAISKSVRNQLLVEARHRCTICSEKCYEIHHIVEQGEGGTDNPENLIVLCPNCHQYRYHRSKEFTKEQLYLYKANLKEQNEIERRLLLNLDEIRNQIGQVPVEISAQQIQNELQEAVNLVSQDKSPDIYTEIAKTSQWLAERQLIRDGARKAIEVEWEIRRQREKAKWGMISLSGINQNGWEKATDFERAYKLVFVLDSIPYPEWQAVFGHAYEHSFPSRKTYVQGNRLIMIVADTDNLQDHADYAKRLVQETNDLILNQVLPKLDLQINREKQQVLQNFDTIQSLKNKTKDIRI